LRHADFIFDFVNGVDRFTESGIGSKIERQGHYRELPLVIDGQSRTARFKTSVSEASNSSWTAREELGLFPIQQARPSRKSASCQQNMAPTVELVERTARTHSSAVESAYLCNGPRMASFGRQAGCVVRGASALRGELQGQDGSLVALHRPSKMPAFDAWGTASVRCH